jgi:hypothetical protein
MTSISSAGGHILGTVSVSHRSGDRLGIHSTTGVQTAYSNLVTSPGTCDVSVVATLLDEVFESPGLVEVLVVECLPAILERREVAQLDARVLRERLALDEEQGVAADETMRRSVSGRRQPRLMNA